MSKKTIRVTCYRNIIINSKATTPWVDVWITIKVRRKIIKLAPCVCGTTGVDYEDFPESNDSNWEMLFTKWDTPIGLEEIVYNSPEVNKIQVERAIELYLQRKGLLKSEPRFKWNKPKITISASSCS